MRVLQLIPSLVGGGAERQLAYISVAMAGLDTDVHVAYVHGGENLSRLKGTAVTLHHLRSLGNHDPMIASRLCALMRRIKPVVVQTWLLQMDVFGGIAARITATPWVLSERSSALMYAQHWKFRLRRALGRFATGIAANSDGGLEYWASVAGPTVRRVIPNAVPFFEIDIARPLTNGIPGLAGGDPLILVAGRYSEEKNLYVLLDALNRTLAKNQSARAVMFGEGPLRGPVSAAKEKLPCSDRIHVLGYCRDLWSWLKRADVYVSVSRFEGNPNTVLEALACGCPVVASDIPAHADILKPPHGILAPPGSAEAISNALSTSLANGRIAREETHAVRGRLLERSPRSVAARYLQLYQAMVEGK